MLLVPRCRCSVACATCWQLKARSLYVRPRASTSRAGRCTSCLLAAALTHFVACPNAPGPLLHRPRHLAAVTGGTHEACRQVLVERCRASGPPRAAGRAPAHAAAAYLRVWRRRVVCCSTKASLWATGPRPRSRLAPVARTCSHTTPLVSVAMCHERSAPSDWRDVCVRCCAHRLAGLTECFIIAPFEVVKVRLQSKARKGA